jgi:hypothetical protein
MRNFEELRELKEFTIGALLFLCTFFVTLLLVGQLYLAFVHTNLLYYHSERSYEELLRSPDRTIRYLFLGDSHALNAANPLYLDGAFNMAGGSEYYFHMYHKLRRVIERDGVRVETAVIEVAPISFSSILVDDQNLLTNTWYYQQYMTFDEMKTMTRSSEAELRIRALFPFIGRGAKAIEFLKNRERTQFYRGWHNNTGLFTADAVQRKKEAELAYVRDYQGRAWIDNTSLAYFVRTLELLHRHNVSVVIVRYPEVREYNDVLEQDGRLAEYYDRILAVAGVTGPYRYLDYHDVFDDHLAFFADPYHLNYNGSEAFMALLKQDLGVLVEPRAEQRQ